MVWKSAAVRNLNQCESETCAGEHTHTHTHTHEGNIPSLQHCMNYTLKRDSTEVYNIFFPLILCLCAKLAFVSMKASGSIRRCDAILNTGPITSVALSRFALDYNACCELYIIYCATSKTTSDHF